MAALTPRSRGAWRLRWKRNRLPGCHLAAAGAGVIAVPYGAELYRCLTKADRTLR